MGEGFCNTIYDFFEPEQTKVTQALSDLEQNILKYEKYDDADSGSGSDEDDKKETKPQGKEETKPSQSQNKVIIKTKTTQQNLSLKKKK